MQSSHSQPRILSPKDDSSTASRLWELPAHAAAFILGCAAFNVLFFVVTAPSIPFVLSDADGGFQMLAARAIAQGRHLYSDFKVNYGPLAYYVSALFQSAEVPSVFPEMALRCLAYALSYTVLFVLCLGFTRRPSVSFAIVVVGLALSPRHYKYYCHLVPMLFMLSLVICRNLRAALQAIILGAVAGVALLFRQDYGAYAALAAGVFLCSNNARQQWSRLLAISALAFGITLSPWLFLVMSHGQLSYYISAVLGVTKSISRELAFPHPLLHWIAWRGSLSFAYALLLPVLGVGAALIRGHDRPVSNRALALSCSLYCLVNYAQASHRADMYHLLQGLGPSFVLIGYLCGLEFKGGMHRALRIEYRAAVLLVPGVLLAFAVDRIEVASPLRFVERWRDYRLTGYEMAVKYSNEAPLARSVFKTIEECTSPTDSVQIFPYYPQLVFLAGRPVAGSLQIVLPGFYSEPKYQHEAISMMKQKPVKMVLWNLDIMLDGMEERKPITTHSIVYEFVKANYRVLGKVGPLNVYMATKEDPSEQCLATVSRSTQSAL